MPEARNESSEPSVEAILPASIQIGASLSTEPSVQPIADDAFASVMNPLESRARVFEVRMPEAFFGQRKAETTNDHAVQPSLQTPIDSAVVNPRTRSEDKTAQPADAQHQLESTVIPERTNELTIEPSQPGPIAEPAAAAQPASVVTEVSMQPSRLIAAPIFEISVPPPALEHTSTSRQPGGASIAPPAPPPRLRINRVDIQVVNQAPPPPPPAHVPDASQLLERKHLGRVELLL